MSILLEVINTAALVMAIPIALVFVLSSIALMIMSDDPQPRRSKSVEDRPAPVIELAPNTSTPVPATASPLKAA